MDGTTLRKFPPHLFLWGLCLLGILTALWLLLFGVEAPRAFIGVALLVSAASGLLLVQRFSVQAREVRQRLAQAEEYIERIANLSQDIHAIIDAATQAYLYVNPAVEKLLGYKPQQFLEGGLSFFHDLVHPEDVRLVKARWDRLLVRSAQPPCLGEEEFSQEEVYRIRNAWGEYRWFRTRRMVHARHPDGSPWEVLAVVSDISEQRALEAALVQANAYEDLGLLARRIAHDLSNLLMGIQGYVDLAQEYQNTPEKMAEALQRIGQNGDRATQLCRQLLAYGGRGRIRLQRHQLNDAIRESLPLIERLVPENIQLVLELEADLPQVNADPNQVRHALLNLVVNALDTLGNREGEIILRSHLKHLEGDGAPALQGLLGDYASLEISDTGSGMSEETLGGIFDPFFRSKHPGRGLGLLTVQGIMREHQGALVAESIPSRGSTFRLFFPVAERGSEQAPAEAAAPAADGEGMILLVDDEPSIRTIFREGLRHAGYSVFEAEDGVEGFGAFVRHRASIRLVLLDLTMPRMGGDEVFREIRKIAPEVPVILMSGYSQQEATSALQGAGPVSFLPKPCSMRQALAAVRKALGTPSDDQL